VASLSGPGEGPRGEGVERAPGEGRPEAPPGIWLVRPEAEAVGERLRAVLGGEFFRPWESPGVPQKAQFAAAFPRRARWVLVMATGIAVRFLEGLPRDKRTDPAAVVLDEGCRFAVALLGGHEGGANRLAYQVARAVGAVPVVTTATESLKPLVVGVGCRRGVGAERIERAVRHALGERSLAEVREVATIDHKAEEPGLLGFCERHGLPLRVFSSAAVAERPWTPRPSEWVRRNLGVAGVCEPCALLASPRGRLIVAKTPLDGVAVAVVEDPAGVLI
jgi:cobalt-precorrin 5A hydrolase